MCRTVHAIVQTLICTVQLLVRMFMTAILMIENLLRMVLQALYNFISFIIQLISLIPVIVVFAITARLKCFLCGVAGNCPVNQAGSCDCIIAALIVFILFLIFRQSGLLEKIIYKFGYVKAKTTTTTTTTTQMTTTSESPTTTTGGLLRMRPVRPKKNNVAENIYDTSQESIDYSTVDYAAEITTVQLAAEINKNSEDNNKYTETTINGPKDAMNDIEKLINDSKEPPSLCDSAKNNSVVETEDTDYFTTISWTTVLYYLQ